MVASAGSKALTKNNIPGAGGSRGYKSGHICSESPLGGQCHPHALKNQYSLLMVTALEDSHLVKAKPELGDHTFPRSLNRLTSLSGRCYTIIQ